MKKAPWLLARAGELVAGQIVTLDPAESRHAGGPLRLTTGAEVELTDGAGRLASGELVVLRRGRADVRIDAVRELPFDQARVNLAVGVLAGSAMDLVVQKAVELGVVSLTPVCCHRSQLGRRRAAARIDHWSKVGRQALKQCRRVWAMEIASPVPLDELAARIGSNGGVVAHPGGLRAEEINLPIGPTLIVGPEGGFDAEEETILEDLGWPRLRLGPHVLRSETAVIAGVAVLTARIEGETAVHSHDG